MKNRLFLLILLILICIIPNFSYAESQILLTDDTISLDDNLMNYYEKPQSKEEIDTNNKINIEKEKQVKEFLLKDKSNQFGTKKINPFTALSYTLYATYVPISTQINAYYCGPATALQTIGNWQNSSTWSYQAENVPSSTKTMWWWSGCCIDGNYSNTVSSNRAHPGSSSHTCYTSYTSPQVTLASIIGTTEAGSTMAGVKNAINTYVNHSSHSYYSTQSIGNTDASKSDLKNHTKFDFANDHSVAYLVDTRYLTRYAGHSSGHFISGYSYEDYGSYTSDMMGLADCNYNPSYGGSYIETFTNVHKALYYHGGTNLAW